MRLAWWLYPQSLAAVGKSRRTLAQNARTMRPHISTLLGEGMVSLVSALPHFAALIGVSCVFVVPWSVYSIQLSIWRPQERGLRLFRVGVWVSLLGIAALVHVHRHTSTQANVNPIAAAISNYIDLIGKCPAELAQVGYSTEDLRAAAGGLSSYHCADGNPTLVYASTYRVFETETYDFEERVWRHDYD